MSGTIRSPRGLSKTIFLDLHGGGGIMAYMGIDLHADTFTVVWRKDLRANSSETLCKYYVSRMKQFIETLKKTDYILIESTTNAFWFYDQVTPFIKDCIVLNTNKFKTEGNKTDKIDARKLLEILTYHSFLGKRNKIPSVYVPSFEVREIRGLFSTYLLTRKISTQLKNRIHSILKQNGISIKKGVLNTKKGKERVLSLPLEEIWMHQIKSLIRQLDSVENELKTIKDMICFKAHQVFETEIYLLLTISGISMFTAAAIMSDAVDVNRFKNVKKFCAYLRTAPGIKESNNTTHLGKVNKCSRSLACTIMTQSINHLKNACSNYFDFYTRLRAGKSAGKTRMALIRKTLVAVYYMLKRNTRFRWVNEDLFDRKKHEYERIIKRVEKSIA